MMDLDLMEKLTVILLFMCIVIIALIALYFVLGVLGSLGFVEVDEAFYVGNCCWGCR